MTAEDRKPILGLIVAILIVLCIAGILVSMFLARFCLLSAKTATRTVLPCEHSKPSIQNCENHFNVSATTLDIPGRSPSGTKSTRHVIPDSPHRIHHARRSVPARNSDPGSIPRAPGSEYSAPGGVYAPNELTPPMILPPTELYGTIPRATLIPRNGQPPSPQDPKDLPFLDPNRKQETQTREELIY
ncbi:hypothetical protein OSTOST_19762 [Ostertagia ostertagi]